MKKNIIIIGSVVAAIGLSAFGYVNSSDGENETPSRCAAPEENLTTEIINDFEFHYGIDTRFIATVSKHALQNANTIHDILPSGSTNGMKSFKDVQVALLEENSEIRKDGDTEILTTEQIALLQKADFAANIRIETWCKKTDSFGREENYHLSYHLTVSPSREAIYKDGNEKLIEILKHGSSKEIEGLSFDDLQPGRIDFLISKEGLLTNVEMESTSGIKEVDNTMLKLMQDLPNSWFPAKDHADQPVSQKLTFFYGIVGC